MAVTNDKPVEEIDKIVVFLEQEPTRAQAIAFKLASHVKQPLTNTIRGIEKKKRTLEYHVLVY